MDRHQSFTAPSPEEKENYFNIGAVVEIAEEHEINEPVNQFEGLAETPEPQPATDYAADAVIDVEEPAGENALPAEQPVIAEERIDGDIEDEVFDEIVGIENISFDGSASDIKTGLEDKDDAETAQAPAIAEKHDIAKEAVAEPRNNREDINFETEKWIIGSIASTDYFMFDNSIADPKSTDRTEPEPLQVRFL
jgi:hypothetical protein